MTSTGADCRVSPSQLVQLADFNIHRAKRRQLDKMESLWLSLQGVILLQSALERLTASVSQTGQSNQPSEQSIHTKLAQAKNEVYSNLKSIIDEQVTFGTDTELNRSVISDWLLQMLDYFKCKFSNEEKCEMKRKFERPRIMPRSRNETKAISETSKREMKIAERVKALEQKEQVRIPPPPSESVRDRISYEKMLLTFNTATAAKYGVNVLDKRCQKTIEDYRSSNVGFEPNWSSKSLVDSEINENQPTIRRRSTSVLDSRPRRPTSLNLSRGSVPDISYKLSSVVSDLKSRAQRLQRRNTVSSPVVPWQTAIKQHKSMIAEILHDFNEQSPDVNASSSQPSSAGSVLVSPPEDFLRRTFTDTISDENGTIESYQLQFQSVTKTVTTRRYPKDGNIFDQNGNRQEIFRRSSVLDSDVKVTYQKSGSLTPDARQLKVSPTLRRSFSLHSFEPVSPLTEVCSMPWLDNPEHFIASSPAVSDKTPDFSPSVSISEDDVLHALANSFFELAERTFSDQKYEEAQNLYEQALSILNRMYKLSGQFQPSVITILKQCGLIRKIKGDSLGAMGIFEQAITVIEKRENGHCRREYQILIAELWYEMGDALIMGGKHTETVAYSVITILRDRETLDFLDAPRSVASDLDLEYTYNAYTTKGQSYPVGAFEALSCYQKAYCKLENLKENAMEPDLPRLIAKVLLKIGDCSILIGDLEVGTDFYENALDCFKATETPYSLADNAHVLVMIGFLHYTNARYSKALVMLQCATIMFHRMENSGDRFERTELALVKSLLCFTSFETEQYAEAVSMGLQCKRMFEDMYGEDLISMNETYTWLTAQSLFVVAKSYQAMNMYETAIETAENICLVFGLGSNLETILRVRILELIGICYEALDQADKALEYYNQALAEYKSQTNLGYSSSALEHTLLSRSAGLHVSMRRYDEAAAYLDRSDFASRDLEDDIRSDMVSLLHHLGETHTIAGHVDRAIDCYTECVDVYMEIHGQLGEDVVKTLGKLANMYHVKAVQALDRDDEQQALFEAEKFYRQAMDIDFSAMLALRYANYLFHQCSFREAILILQRLIDTCEIDEISDVTFAGVEQVLVPVLLQSECDEDELCLPAKLLNQYLLVLSFCAIGQLPSAEYYLLDMIYNSDFDTLSLSVIGYSLLEFRLYMEAYHWFDLADRRSSYPASTLAWENKLFCVALEVFTCLRRGVLFLYEYANGIGSFPVTPSPIL